MVFKNTWLSRKMRNKKIKMSNGNSRVKQVIKLVHWNMGSTWWERKKDEVLTVIEEYSPDILFISEANMRNDLPVFEKEIDGYDLIVPKTAARYGHARLVLLIREEVEYKIIENWMNNDSATIWIRIVTKGRKPINIGGTYREHRIIMQPTPNNSWTPALQQLRWDKTLEGWKKAGRKSRCILIGDTNLDFFKWEQPDSGHR